VPQVAGVKVVLLDFMSFEEFVEWYAELGKLKIFWAKPVESVSLLSKEGSLYLVGVKQVIGNRIKEAILAITGMVDKVPKAIDSLKTYGSLTKILIVPEEAPINLSLTNARSALYFWNINARTLEPNKDVRTKTFYEWSENDIEMFRRIHEQSWGFFIPPRRGDHAVLTALLNDSPVGIAYLNIHNFNIDYGIHVIKPYWRRRIGTALLAKSLELAKFMGASNISVVRVFRSVKGTPSDTRATKFYKANNPPIKLSIYRLNNDEK
jgi:GNAT superfamily N-acetyltransferase